jgi:hypothetical protein
MEAALDFFTPPASHVMPEHLALQQTICGVGAFMEAEFCLRIL